MPQFQDGMTAQVIRGGQEPVLFFVQTVVRQGRALAPVLCGISNVSQLLHMEIKGSSSVVVDFRLEGNNLCDIRRLQATKPTWSESPGAAACR